MAETNRPGRKKTSAREPRQQPKLSAADVDVVLQDFERLRGFEERKALILRDHPELRDLQDHDNRERLRDLLREDSPRADRSSPWFMRMAMPVQLQEPRRSRETADEARRRRIDEIKDLPLLVSPLLSALDALSRWGGYHHFRPDADRKEWLFEFAYLHALTFGLWSLVNAHGFVLQACWPEPFRIPLGEPSSHAGRLCRAASAHEALRDWSVAALYSAQVAVTDGGEPLWTFDPGRLEQDQRAFLILVAGRIDRARSTLCKVVPKFDSAAWQQRLNFETLAALQHAGSDAQDLADRVDALSLSLGGLKELAARQASRSVHGGSELGYQVLALLRRRSMNETEIRRALGAPRKRLHRVMVSLQEQGSVEHDVESGLVHKWRPSEAGVQHLLEAFDDDPMAKNPFLERALQRHEEWTPMRSRRTSPPK